MAKKSLNKWQFGDFQTPDDLAQQVIAVLKSNHGINPDVVIEPSCGKGAFIRSALNGFRKAKVLGLDINSDYTKEARSSISEYSNSTNAIIETSDFFETNWEKILSEHAGSILITGNPPWVTSSELSLLSSDNLPEKSNFQGRRGIESITGSGNFDISEWMLLQYIAWLSKREGTIAILCKYAVARKVILQASRSSGHRFSSCIYLVDAKAYFGASVEACLFVLSTNSKTVDCKVYSRLSSGQPSYIIGKRDGMILRDIVTYEKWRHLAGQDLKYIWRSGVKHDCARVMELERINEDLFQNGIGERYALEQDYLYPLLKSSDIGNNRIETYRKLILMAQESVGEDTSGIQGKAPNVWNYLLKYNDLLSDRKSSIYKNKPSYSIFGVGSYTFRRWKVAISGLYKKLNFCLVGPLDGKVVIFDDTVNFLSFDTEVEARFIFELVTSEPALEFLDSMIFWDEKRPVTINILRRLSLHAVAKELNLMRQYQDWATTVQVTASGQLELGLAETH
jgi:hypothetical protein